MANNAYMSPLLMSRLNKIPSLNQQLNQDTFQKQTEDKNKLSIFYYNDTHGNSDQMAGVINAAKNFKQQKALANSPHFVLSAGDNSSGADTKKNQFIYDLMQNYMHVDASAIGNHEIDGAKEGFKEASEKTNFPFIATNVKFDDAQEIKNLKTSIIKEQDGIKYGFVGTMPLDFTSCTKDEVQKGIEVMNFEDTIKALQNEINDLKAQGADRIIMLSHTGYENDQELAKNIDGIDVIIGGHSHSVVEGIKENENLLKSKSGEPVLIVQAGENGKYSGVLDVEFNDDGILTKVQNKLIENLNQQKSPTIQHIKNTIVGKSPEIGKLTEVEPLPENRRVTPCAWTAVMADSMKEAFDTDIALINSANIRKVPKEGILTEEDVQESAPMKNNLVKTKITQKQLVDALQNAARQTFGNETGYPGILQGSGFTYKMDEKGNLLELNIIDKNGNANPVDINNPSDEITYTTMLDSFVIKEDGETPELHPKFEIEEFDFDKDKTMIDYLKKSPDTNDIKIKYDNRIEIVKSEQ